MGVQADLMNSDINALYISQSGLIMGDRDYYLDPENEPIRSAYKEYLGKIFRLAGVPETDIDKAVAGVMSIETKLAEKNWSSVELRNIPAMYNPTKKADFEKAYDAIDWAEYYGDNGHRRFRADHRDDPLGLANANELMKTAPLERSATSPQYIGAAASYLSDDFQRVVRLLRSRDVGASSRDETSPLEAAMFGANGLTGGRRRDVRGQVLPREGQSPDARHGEEPANGLGQHIAALDWMSDATKAKAQEKLAAFTVKIGYPDKWKDYSTLAIDPSKSYWENIVEANAWYTSDNISKLGKPVDRTSGTCRPRR